MESTAHTSSPYKPPAHVLLDKDGQPRPLLQRWQHAKQRRSVWEGHWQDCYSYALPLRDSVIAPAVPGAKKGDLLFDGTACDAVDQLAASLLAELTPPWARWFGLTTGVDLDETERDQLAPLLDKATAVIERAVLSRACLRLLSSADGVLVMDYLKARTLERCLGPETSDRALWMLEGQRYFVLHLLSLAEQWHHAPTV